MAYAYSAGIAISGNGLATAPANTQGAVVYLTAAPATLGRTSTVPAVFTNWLGWVAWRQTAVLDGIGRSAYSRPIHLRVATQAIFEKGPLDTGLAYCLRPGVSGYLHFLTGP